MRKILFVCNQGKYRSPTACNVWKSLYPEDKVDYEGVFTGRYFQNKINWADKVIVMEDQQYDEIVKKYPKLSTMQKIEILNIEDIYKKDDPKLIKILRNKLLKVDFKDPNDISEWMIDIEKGVHTGENPIYFGDWKKNKEGDEK